MKAEEFVKIGVRIPEQCYKVMISGFGSAVGSKRNLVPRI